MPRFPFYARKSGIQSEQRDQLGQRTRLVILTLFSINDALAHRNDAIIALKWKKVDKNRENMVNLQDFLTHFVHIFRLEIHIFRGSSWESGLSKIPARVPPCSFFTPVVPLVYATPLRMFHHSRELYEIKCLLGFWNFNFLNTLVVLFVFFYFYTFFSGAQKFWSILNIPYMAVLAPTNSPIVA